MTNDLTSEPGPPTRELARRLSGAYDVLLVWHPETNVVELRVVNVTTGDGFRVEIAPAAALDAFRHPFAYASGRTRVNHLVPARTGC